VFLWRDGGISPKLISFGRLQADISMGELPNLQHRCYSLSQNSRCWQTCSYLFFNHGNCLALAEMGEGKCEAAPALAADCP
jgi:hypothetical protein